MPVHAQARNVSSEDAKIKFLKIVYQWSTFGSAFFEVKVREKGYLLFRIRMKCEILLANI